MEANRTDGSIFFIAAAVLIIFLIIHGNLNVPWDLLYYDNDSIALGTWAIAPCTLAAVAILIGAVDLSQRRGHPVAELYCQALVIVVPLVALAIISALHEPKRYLPQDWIADLFPTALVVGIGLALCTFFWQGVVQLKMPDTWFAPVRALVVAAAAATIWIPFWWRTETPVDGAGLWWDLAILSIVAAILHELGFSTRVVAVLIAFCGTVAVYLHHGALL